MKMVLMNYYVGMDDEVKEMLSNHDVCTFTRFPEVEGRISCGEPREGSHVWPGNNSTLIAVMEDGVARALVEDVRAFNERVHGEGVDCYVLDVAQRVLAKEHSEAA